MGDATLVPHHADHHMLRATTLETEAHMTVIAFRPRPAQGAEPEPSGYGVPVVGDLRSPSGRAGQMLGHFRVRRLVLAPRGAFLTGVVTGELLDADGTLIGRDSSQVTAAADLVRAEAGLVPTIHGLQLDLMGIRVRVRDFSVGSDLRLLQNQDPSAPAQESRALRRERLRRASRHLAGAPGQPQRVGRSTTSKCP